MTITWMMWEVGKLMFTLFMFVVVFCGTFYVGWKVGKAIGR